MTFEEYVVAAANYAVNNKNERMGQAYFNTLAFNREDIAQSVIESSNVGYPVDPFYDDKNIPRFLAHVAAKWEN